MSLSDLFGHKPKAPKVIPPTPVEKVQQLSSIATDESTRKRLAKIRKATILTQQQKLGVLKLKTEKLGAGT